MAATGPDTLGFAIRGPIARADLPGLCARVCTLLSARDGADFVLCDVTGIDSDAVTVDALARLQLAAQRQGCQVQLCNASGELLELVTFMGLQNVCPAEQVGDEFRDRLGSIKTNPLIKEDDMASNGSRMLFVNLPVKDLDRSVDFFTQLGFSFNPQFTDETATQMIISDDAFVMLLVENRFKDFTKKELVDATRHTEVIMALSAESRDAVDELADKALEAGGSPANDPLEMGLMYGRSFQDIDGHIWEVIWMDPSEVNEV